MLDPTNKKDTPHLRAKEKPQQDGRKGEISFRIKAYACQRHLKGSNKPSAHQDLETPQRLSQNCVVSVSCGGMGQQWPPHRGRSSGCTIALNSCASKVILKILQARRQQYVNRELPDVQAGKRQ